ncbi:MAG: N-acetylgalactosamine-N, N-diacetylbacillosaminyl-diphospho-undecaprenol, partial [Planctomycetota bacterium]
MKRIRVVFAIGGMHGGGSERQLLLLLQHLDRQTFDPVLYLAHRVGPLLQQLPEDVPLFVSEERIPQSKLYFPGRIHRLRVRDYADCLRQLKADVSYDRTFLMTLITAAGAQQAGVPNVSTIVTNPETGFAPVAGRFQWLKRRLLHKLYNRSTQVLAVSNGVREAAIRFYGIQPAKIRTLYNGIDLSQIHHAAQQPVTDSWWLAPPSSPHKSLIRIVAVGRLNHEKGFHLLVEAAQLLTTQHPQLELRIALLGEGSHRTLLQQQIRRTGLESQIQLPGFQQHPAAWIASANALVLPSLVEGMPNVLLEALALCTPVIAADCPSGPAEVLENGRLGLLVPVANPAAITQALLQLLKHPEQTIPRALAGKLAIQQHWTI